MQVSKIKIVVLGAGSFGHAIADVVSRNPNNNVVLWARSKSQCD